MEDKSINAGKVGLTMGGDWKSSESYEKLTCVSHNGRSWVAKKNVSAGVEPSEANSAFWQLMSDRGAQGIQGPVGPQGNSAYVKDGVVNKFELVNNLTQGGQTAALSAEQGKILKQELTELESEISNINKEEVDSADDCISIEDETGKEVFHLDENGLDAKNVKSNGIDVLNEILKTQQSICFVGMHTEPVVVSMSNKVLSLTIPGFACAYNKTFNISKTLTAAITSDGLIRLYYDESTKTLSAYAYNAIVKSNVDLYYIGHVNVSADFQKLTDIFILGEWIYDGERYSILSNHTEIEELKSYINQEIPTINRTISNIKTEDEDSSAEEVVYSSDDEGEEFAKIGSENREKARNCQFEAC